MLQTLINKYKSAEDEYLIRSPKEKWLFVRNIGIFIFALAGVPVFDPKFKIYFYSYSAGIVIVDVIISFFYTLWYYLNTPTPINGLLVLPIFSIVIPVKKKTLKFHQLFLYHDYFHFLTVWNHLSNYND